MNLKYSKNNIEKFAEGDEEIPTSRKVNFNGVEARQLYDKNATASVTAHYQMIEGEHCIIFTATISPDKHTKSELIRKFTNISILFECDAKLKGEETTNPSLMFEWGQPNGLLMRSYGLFVPYHRKDLDEYINIVYRDFSGASSKDNILYEVVFSDYRTNKNEQKLIEQGVLCVLVFNEDPSSTFKFKENYGGSIQNTATNLVGIPLATTMTDSLNEQGVRNPSCTKMACPRIYGSTGYLTHLYYTKFVFNTESEDTEIIGKDVTVSEYINRYRDLIEGSSEYIARSKDDNLLTFIKEQIDEADAMLKDTNPAMTILGHKDAISKALLSNIFESTCGFPPIHIDIYFKESTEMYVYQIMYDENQYNKLDDSKKMNSCNRFIPYNSDAGKETFIGNLKKIMFNKDNMKNINIDNAKNTIFKNSVSNKIKTVKNIEKMSDVKSDKELQKLLGNVGISLLLFLLIFMILGYVFPNPNSKK